VSRGTDVLLWVIGAALIVAGVVVFVHGHLWGVVIVIAGLIVGPVPWYDE